MIKILLKFKKEIGSIGYNIFIASSISLFILLIIWYFSTLPAFKSAINMLNTLTLSVLILCLFLFILALPYRIKILRTIIIILSIIVTPNELEEYYCKNYPFIIMGIGYSLTLFTFLAILNFPPQHPNFSTLYGLILGGILFFGLFIFIPLGIILFIVSFLAKKYLEGQVSFTLEKANKILSRAKKNQLDNKDVKNLKRYIYLTYRNIKRKFRTLDLEYTFFNLLSDYLEVARKYQLESLKDNLEIMSKSIKEKDEIGLTAELLKLNKNIINHIREIGFNVIDQKLSGQSSWMLRNKDTIVNVIIMVVSIVTAILTYLQYQLISVAH